MIQLNHITRNNAEVSIQRYYNPVQVQLVLCIS